MALAAKVRDDELVLIDELSFAAPKTKDMAAILKHAGLRRRHAAGGDRRARRQRVPERPQHRRRVGVAGRRPERLERAVAAAAC